MSSKSWYMHTMNSQPAAFDPSGGYIYYIGRSEHCSPLVPDLATIRRQQAIAREADARDGTTWCRYDYIRFPRRPR